MAGEEQVGREILRWQEAQEIGGHSATIIIAQYSAPSKSHGAV